MSITTDPISLERPEPSWRFLLHLNPLAKIGALLPAIIVLLIVRGLAVPLTFAVLGLVIALIGARLTGRMLAALLLGAPAVVLLLTVTFGVWTDPATVADTPVVLTVGDAHLYAGALLAGFSTALRLVAVLLLVAASALGTEGPALVRALVAHLHVPYRFGYAALAAFRFVPRFRYELELIRQAHRVRGTTSGRGPIAAVRRGLGYVIPLLAGAIRHAERVALAMDSRAFGAYPARTERHPSVWRASDTAYVAALWIVTAGVVIAAAVLNAR